MEIATNPSVVIALPIQPFRFTQRTRLVEYKSKLTELIPNFVDHTQTNASGDFNDFFATPSEIDFPKWSTGNLLASLQIPGNYLTYTPRLMLNGYGRFGITNDNFEGYGVPFGFTNAATGAGGTNFPVARTNFPTWKTTDYGWIYMTNVINSLIWTRGVGQVDQVQVLTNAFSQIDTNWLTLRDLFIDHFTNETFWADTNLPAVGSQFDVQFGTNTAIFVTNFIIATRPNSRPVFSLTNIAVQSEHDSEVYIAGFSAPIAESISSGPIMVSQWPVRTSVKLRS